MNTITPLSVLDPKIYRNLLIFFKNNKGLNALVFEDNLLKFDRITLAEYKTEQHQASEKMARELPEQEQVNQRYLLSAIDRIHAALCPGKSGTWQMRVEQAIEASERKLKENLNHLANNIKSHFADCEKVFLNEVIELVRNWQPIQQSERNCGDKCGNSACSFSLYCGINCTELSRENPCEHWQPVPGKNKCPQCGANCFDANHTPCSDHPELTTTRRECSRCDWHGDEMPIPDNGEDSWKCPKCGTINGSLNKICRHTPCSFKPNKFPIPAGKGEEKNVCSECKNPDLWLSKMDMLLKQCPKGFWLWAADGGLYLMQYGSDGKRKINDNFGMDQAAIFGSKMTGPEIDGGAW